MPDHRLWPLILTALTTASCAEGRANFRVRYEPGFTASAATISVLGVFQGGGMTPEAGGQVGPPLSAALGGRSCDAGYGDKLAAASPDLIASIDDSVRSEGITEEMLD